PNRERVAYDLIVVQHVASKIVGGLRGAPTYRPSLSDKDECIVPGDGKRAAFVIAVEDEYLALCPVETDGAIGIGEHIPKQRDAEERKGHGKKYSRRYQHHHLLLSGHGERDGGV